MTSATNRTRILNPLERFSEIVFGLIMVLSFTGALSVAEVGREDIRIMLFGAIGCNLAWGIIDAAFYLINCLAERGRNATILRSVQRATNPTHAQRLIADALPEPVATALQPTDFERVREHLSGLPRPPTDHGSRRRIGAEPSASPARLSLHVPRGCAVSLHARRQTGVARLKFVAIAMLFGAGCLLAGYAGMRRIRTGLAMVGIGAVLVALTIVLGG